MNYYGYGFDYTYVLVIIGFLITLIAQLYIKSSYSKYKKINTKSGLDGYEVARRILNSNGLNNIDIVETEGELSDHYDPSRKVVRLSTDVYHGKSIASSSIAAHECGHAVQDKEGYFFLRFRSAMVPFANISSKIGYIAVVIGLVAGITNLIWIGIALEMVILLFQIITLPVEINASNRAAKFLALEALVEKSEQTGSKKMLNAAALTYVASVLSTLLSVLRLVLIASNRNRRR
ncbi:MAG: zinc metallopeptidase [Bacilli bacterium]|nr:zinc metallopeptidase [Bacilli bacterium]